jgi:CIC family chloride channel protein
VDLKVIPGALVASVISSFLAGWGPTLMWPGYASAVWSYLFLNSVLLGILCGITARLYASTFGWTKKTFKDVKLFQPLKPALGGLMVGLLGLLYPQVLGLGYGWLQVSVSMQTSWLAIPLWIIITLPIAKLLATSLCVGSGGIGGIFGPGMIIGGLLGEAYWSVLHALPLPVGIIPGTPAIFVVIGMVALLGPIARTPVAVTAMVANLTGNVLFVPAAVCALIVSSWIVQGATIYPSQQ